MGEGHALSTLRPRWPAISGGVFRSCVVLQWSVLREVFECRACMEARIGKVIVGTRLRGD